MDRGFNRKNALLLIQIFINLESAKTSFLHYYYYYYYYYYFKKEEERQ